jgi:hypothetical protein
MDIVTLLKQGLLFAHVILFAVAMGEILRGDWRLLRNSAIDIPALEATAQIVLLALGGLWVTGLGLTFLDTGFVPSVMAQKPKLLSKLIVVVALSFNGLLLHMLAFPMLKQDRTARYDLALVCAVLGAISTASWLFAAFLGVGRIIAPNMTLAGFLALYGLALAVAVIAAIAVVAPMLRHRTISGLQQARLVHTDRDDEAFWLADQEGQSTAQVAILHETHELPDQRVAS